MMAAVVLICRLIVGGIFPAFWLLLTSLKTDGELIRQPITYLPDAATLAAKMPLDDERVTLQTGPFGIQATFETPNGRCTL